MQRILGWAGLIAVALVGAVASFGGLYLFASSAPYFWLLITLPLLVAAVIAALLGMPVARFAGLRRETAAGIAAVLAVLPLAGLVGAMLLSPALPRADAGTDPRGPHRTLRTAAGSSLAWWSIAPPQPTHRTPVVFLHGGPGSFTRNRDFKVAQGFRDAGFPTVFYDQSGSGASGNLPIGQYTLANAVADLEALRRTLRADKLVLWGQSWGASLATAYVRAHPDRVAATILDSPGDFPGEPLPLDYSKTDSRGDFEPKLREATLFLLIGHAPQLAERWQSQDDARATQQARVDRITTIYGFQCKGDRTPLRRPLSPPGGNLYPQLRLQHDLGRQPRINGVVSRAPALLIRGACDYLPLATAARYMKAFPATQRIDVPGRGHAFFGHDDELRAILNRFASTTLRMLS